MLSTAEDVISALKSGATVRLWNHPGTRIRMVNGFMVKDHENEPGMFSINYTINMKDRPYTEIEGGGIPEEGESWMTVGGYRAVVLKKLKGRPGEDYRLAVMIEMKDGSGIVVETDMNGDCPERDYCLEYQYDAG